MSGIGDIPMPPGFRYKKVYARGRPRHAKTDAFRIRHPRMTLRRRAKLFAPFDALRGFSGAVAAKNVQYERKRVLNEEALAELDRRMRILLALTGNGPLARQNRVRVSVTWYVPCQDPDHEAFGVLGSCQTLTGICLGRTLSHGQPFSLRRRSTILIKSSIVYLFDINTSHSIFFCIITRYFYASTAARASFIFSIFVLIISYSDNPSNPIFTRGFR